MRATTIASRGAFETDEVRVQYRYEGWFTWHYSAEVYSLERENDWTFFGCNEEMLGTPRAFGIEVTYRN